MGSTKRYALISSRRSLRELLECVRINQPEPDCAPQENHVQGSDNDSDSGPSATEDECSDSPTYESDDPYLDAGYSTKEDYLLNHFGGCGGTAKERAELAAELRKALDVGPMADAIFYDELAICFIRCRERYHRKVLRKENKSMTIMGGQPNEKDEKGGSPFTSMVMAEKSIKFSPKMVYLRRRKNFPTDCDSDCSINDDKDDVAESVLLTDGVISFNINSRTEKSTVMSSGTGTRNEEKNIGLEQEEDSFIDPTKHALLSETADGDEDDQADELRATTRHAKSNEAGDSYDPVRMSMISKAGVSISFGCSDNEHDDGDDEISLDVRREFRSSMFTNKDGFAHSFRSNVEFLDEENKISSVSTHQKRNSEADMESDNEDDEAPCQRRLVITEEYYERERDVSCEVFSTPHQVHLKRGKYEIGQYADIVGRYPSHPPPPPPPLLRGQNSELNTNHKQVPPFDVDSVVATWVNESNRSTANRRFAQGSAFKKDCEHKSCPGSSDGEAEQNDLESHRRHTVGSLVDVNSAKNYITNQDDRDYKSEPLTQGIRNLNFNRRESTTKTSCGVVDQEDEREISVAEKDLSHEEEEDSFISPKKRELSFRTSEDKEYADDELRATTGCAKSDKVDQCHDTAGMSVVSNDVNLPILDSVDPEDDDDNDDVPSIDVLQEFRSSMFTNKDGIPYGFGSNVAMIDDEIGLSNLSIYQKRLAKVDMRPDGTPLQCHLIDEDGNRKRERDNDGEKTSKPSHQENSIHHEEESTLDFKGDIERCTFEKTTSGRRLAQDSDLRNNRGQISKSHTIGPDAEARRNNHLEPLRRHTDIYLGSWSQTKPVKITEVMRQKSDFGFDDASALVDKTSTEIDNELGLAKRQQVSLLREEGRLFYINGSYRESVRRYTEAIKVQINYLHSLHTAQSDSTLIALYGNRAAALMMTGAYTAAAADCNRAIQCTGSDSSAVSMEVGPVFRSKIFCRKARALLKAGNVRDAEKAFRSAAEATNAALSTISDEEARQAQNNFDQCHEDITLGLSNVKRYQEALEGATMSSTESASSDSNPERKWRKTVNSLMFINAALSLSPGSMELHQRKVNALAALKRWAELGNHCERLAAEMVKMDGLFHGDLDALNPFPDVSHATDLNSDFFEENPGDLADPPSLRLLSPRAVRDAVVRLPTGIVPIYLRSLRLEERYAEAACGAESIEAHMNENKTKGGIVSIAWLTNEKDKLRRTMLLKSKGDTLFRSGDYEGATAKYAQCLEIDGDTSKQKPRTLVNDNAGGRLHAVLHCNRAACLIALHKYQEAIEECTLALQIHKNYMRAMLRRGRCFARLRQYGEAVSQYERFIQLVDEAKRSTQSAFHSGIACTFDRPIDISPAEYAKAKLELADVKNEWNHATRTAKASREKQTSRKCSDHKNSSQPAGFVSGRRRSQDAPGRTNYSSHTQKQQLEASGANNRCQDQFSGESSPKPTQYKLLKNTYTGGAGPSSGPNANRIKQHTPLQP